MTHPSILTGGQLCVRGILHQMMRGLAHGISLVIKPGIFEDDALNSVMLILEPLAGGDHQALVGGRRVAEQVKIRTNGKAWTAGEIAGEVFPNLLQAVKAGGPATTYRFTTDGALNCEDLLKLCARLKSRPVPDDPVAALDDCDPKAFNYGGWISERTYFLALAKRADKCTDYPRLWTMLAGFEVEGDLTDARLTADIDAFLADIVDAHEQVEAKRDQLVGTMMRLAKEGAERTVAALLAEAGMPVERMLHYVRLPEFTRQVLDHQLALLGYDPVHDVRTLPLIAPLGLSLIAGESGFGKSWRMASELRRRDHEGQLTVWVSNAIDLTSVLKKIVEIVWHSSFDADQSLSGLKRRLEHRYIDDAGAWLTVGVDDVQSRALLEEMRAANWGAYGVRLLATVPPEHAKALAAKPLPPEVHHVGRFTLPQLRRFLHSHGKELRTLPSDVLELLQVPIFAELYRQIDTSDWVPTNEYALVDRYWHHATYEARDMAKYQDDVAALVRIAGTLRTPAGRYPWPATMAQHSGLNQEARRRLVVTGILRQSEIGSQVIHDRILNWAVSRSLLDDLTQGERDAAGTVAALIAIDKSETLAPGLGRRLGYVLLDFLWLASGAIDAATIASIVDELIEKPEFRINARNLIQEDMAGLGGRILPALAILATMPDTNRGPIAQYAAKAIAAIGLAEPGSADQIVLDLLASSGDERAMRAGLIAAAVMPLPIGMEKLWSTHVARCTTSDAVPANNTDERYKSYRRQEESGDALTKAVIASPEFIEAKLSTTSGDHAAEILLDLLLKVDQGAGSAIWARSKATFLARVPPGKSRIADAIGRFQDVDEVERLEQASASHDSIEPFRRFDALIRVAPKRAAAHISQLEPDVARRPWFSMTRLIRNGGPGVRAALRDRQAVGWEGMADLANLYWRHPLLIDADSFVAIIVAFEARLGEIEGGPTEMRHERILLEFLAGTTRPDLLDILATYRGSRFEQLLSDRAATHRGRTTLSVDPDADNCERLLLAIGGDGYGARVAAALTDASPFARKDGYEAGAKLPLGAPGAAGLADAVNNPKRTDHEAYALMVALAAHKIDAALYKLVKEMSSAFNDAIDVRKKQGEWPAAIDAQIRIDLTSTDSNTRIGATCALAMAPPADVATLLAETLARCLADDPSALTVVLVASQLDVYHPSMRAQLQRMANLADEKAREEVVPYLAEHGDDEARAVASGMLAANLTGPNDRATLRAAYALSTHDPTNPIAIAKLRPFIERNFGFYPVGLIARRLADGGALADEAFVDIGYIGKRLSAADIDLLVDRIAQTDSEEALAITERRFDDTPSAGSARQLLDLGGVAAIDHLLGAYGKVKSQEVQWIIARALRCHADRKELLARLRNLAWSDAVADRVTAAELLGWVPAANAREMLASLTEDRHPDVSDAAIKGEERQLAEQHARTLIAQIPTADHYGKWTRLWALTDLADPILLEGDTTGLAIGPMLDSMGEIFAIWTEKALDDRRKALINEAERRDKSL